MRTHQPADQKCQMACSKKLPRLLYLTALSVIAGCSMPPPATKAAATTAPAQLKPASVEVVKAQFGVFGADDRGHRVLFETDKFPAMIAAPYGWYIIYKTDKPTVIWREEFELPNSLEDWGPGEMLGLFTLSPDRKTAVTERIVPSGLGFIANEWRYAPGDPVGAHAIRVYIDGQLIRDFRFNIENGPGGESAPLKPKGPRALGVSA